MQEIINKSVLIHSCRPKTELIPRDLLVPNERYIGEQNIEKQVWFRRMPKSCRCKRRTTLYQADEFVANGWAIWIVKVKKGAVIPDESRIWMPVVRERVPRIDLIAKADIERSVIGSERKSKHFVYDSSRRKFVKVGTIPDGMTRQDWMMDYQREEAFERHIRKQYSQYIQECFLVAMQARKELIAPFRKDPFEGRALFNFSDQRTAGGRG